MLWAVRHLWLDGACFAAVHYLHQATMVLQQPGGKAKLLLLRKGVVQGYLVNDYL